MRSVGDRGEAADDRVACDVRNDGRGTPIATLLAHAPDAIRGDGSAPRGAHARGVCVGPAERGAPGLLNIAGTTLRLLGPGASLDLGHLG